MMKTHHAYLIALASLFLLFFMEFLDLLHLSGLRYMANQVKAYHYQWLLRASQPFQQFAHFWQLSAKLEDLQYRYAEAAAAISQVESLRAENQELRRLLENTDRSYEQTVISAPLISFATPSVGVGSNQGVQTGAAVLYQDNLLGLITTVEARQAQVSLLHQLLDRGLVVRTNSGTTGLLLGNGREILLTEVPRDVTLNSGELVFTAANPGLGAGLVVGRVGQHKELDEAVATQTVVIEPLVHFYEVALVEIK